MHEIVRRFGIVSALALALFEFFYVAVLVGGLVSLESPGDPISDPFFTMMELLILLIVPAMVIMMIAVHAWAPASRKSYSLAAIVFAAILACLTSAVHFSILVLGREPDLAVWARHLSFEWPSIVYALDILAWDWFFALSVLFAVRVFRGSRLANWIRYLLIASGVLALAGLVGVVVGDMQIRNIGIVGYAGIFPFAALLIALLFWRTPKCGERLTEGRALRPPFR